MYPSVLLNITFFFFFFSPPFPSIFSSAFSSLLLLLPLLFLLLFLLHILCKWYFCSNVGTGLNTPTNQLTFGVKICAPEGRLGIGGVSPCLESQGCRLIPLYYLLSCSSADKFPLLFLTCVFFVFVFCWLAYAPDFFPENCSVFFTEG